MDTPLLQLVNVSCSVENSQQIFDDLNLELNEGDILALRGRSGCGKSTLLKCISHLIQHKGVIKFRGKTAKDLGIPNYRTKVLYVPQRPSLLPGSPSTFLQSILALSSQTHARPKSEQASSAFPTVHARAADITESWDVDLELWERDWGHLSGGEAQRMLLALALALDTAEVILLDEPTSALDEETSLLVEQCITDQVKSPTTRLKAVIWITHSAEQGRRVATRTVRLSGGKCVEGFDSESTTPSSRLSMA
ncbi:ATP-binding cassette transporter [Coprinopsis sp. MPI-PUGE-AT-0042]|nr:ATP-binding cassette transporter [Coprinopsis sp. MPI-PUGE-AT-0042]